MQGSFALPECTIKNSKDLVQLDKIKNWKMRKLNLGKRQGKKEGREGGESGERGTNNQL